MINVMTDSDLLELLPPWYREVYDYQEICSAEQPSFEAAAAQMLQILSNFFPQTMDVQSIELWEKALDIMADPAAETLEFRRERIINRISTKPPFTLGFLYQKLDEFVGKGLYTVTVDYPNYALIIESNALEQAYSQELEFTVNRIKPAHITYMHRSVVAADILVSEQIQKTRYDWNYKLGEWEIGELPFGSALENEVIKLASQNSVQEAMIGGLASATLAAIVSARLNGSLVISDITKSAAEGTVTVSYPISSDDISVITSAELLDAAGTPLFSASVYVPVVDTVTLKHSITIKEGE